MLYPAKPHQSTETHKLNATNFIRILPVTALVLALTPFSWATDSPKLIIQGTENTELDFALQQSDTMDVLPDGSIVARIVEPAVCETGPGECPTCPDVCDATIGINQFEIRTGGQTYGANDVITVSHGATLAFRWRAPGAVSCSGSGASISAWTQVRDAITRNDVSVGTSGLPVPDELDTYNLTLTCRNGDSLTVQRSVTLRIEADQSTPEECVGVPSLAQANSTFTRATTIIANQSDPQDGTEFSAVWLAPFPGIGVQRQIRLLPNQYASIRFDTPSNLNSNSSGNFTIEMMAGYNTATRLMSISRCQGDFNPQTAGEACVRSLTGLDNFRWEGVSHPTRCVLQPGQQYYLNIVHSDSPAGTPLNQITPSCVPGSIGYCGNLYLHAHNL